MKKQSLLIILLCAFFFSACSPEMMQQAGKVLKESQQGGAVTQDEAGKGIKQALIQGISKGVADVSATNGYFNNSKIRIPFPPEAQNVENKLRSVGLGKEVDKAILSLNRAAEEAAKEAKPIFIGAIKQLTFKDALNIVAGKEDAATRYLDDKTSAQLHAKFKPIINRSLQKVNATKYWGSIMSQYNKIPFVQKVDTDLDEYVTQRAIDGLFVMIAKEELEIRKNPAARSTALLKKVFSSKNM